MRGRGLIAAAWVLSLLSVANLWGGFLLVLTGSPAEVVAPMFVGGGVGVVLSMGLSFWGALRRTEAAGAHLLFDTWFPMFMAMVPLAGPFIAMWSAIKLLVRDKLTPATITTSSGSSSSTSHYGVVPLHGAGRPAGLLLVALASLQPLIALVIIQDDENAVEDEAVEAVRTLEQQACRDVLACYRTADHIGGLAGRVEMDVSEEGRVLRLEARLPEAPDRIRTCVQGLAGSARFGAYRGPSGRLVCDFAGALSGPASEVKQVGRFTPNPERSAGE